MLPQLPPFRTHVIVYSIGVYTNAIVLAVVELKITVWGPGEVYPVNDLGNTWVLEPNFPVIVEVPNSTPVLDL